MHLFDFPDLKAITKLLTSETEIARQWIERIVYNGEDLTPEPMMRLEPTLELARRYYLQARLEGAPEANLEKLRNFMTQVEEMLAHRHVRAVRKDRSLVVPHHRVEHREPAFELLVFHQFHRLVEEVLRLAVHVLGERLGGWGGGGLLLGGEEWKQ